LGQCWVLWGSLLDPSGPRLDPFGPLGEFGFLLGSLWVLCNPFGLALCLLGCPLAPIGAECAKTMRGSCALILGSLWESVVFGKPQGNSRAPIRGKCAAKISARILRAYFWRTLGVFWQTVGRLWESWGSSWVPKTPQSQPKVYQSEPKISAQDPRTSHRRTWP
jgi:hypothetical protein